MRRLLFVDDESAVVEALRQALMPMRSEWDMSFVQSGNDALAHLQTAPVDIVLSDLAMPGMDGLQLLGEVRKQYPNVVCIAFTGETGQETSLRSAGVAHQFLSKPFSTDDLKSVIGRTCALHDLLASEALRKLVSGIKSLPSLPNLYRDLNAEIQSRDASVKKVAKLIARDMSMVTKILQMVNSAFFGLRTQVSNPEQAVLLLGLETIKSLVLSMQVFSQFEGSQSCFSLDVLWRHATMTSSFARAIAMKEQVAQAVAEDAFAAALLHDVGTLVLATNLPDKFTESLALQQNEKLTEWEAERQVLGATHAEIGGYLLGIWGLGDSLVEAVAFHHSPMMCISQELTPLMAVHVADALEEESRAEAVGEEAVSILDETYLAQCGMADRIPGWRAHCRALAQGS